ADTLGKGFEKAVLDRFCLQTDGDRVKTQLAFRVGYCSELRRIRPAKYRKFDFFPFPRSQHRLHLIKENSLLTVNCQNPVILLQTGLVGSAARQHLPYAEFETRTQKTVASAIGQAVQKVGRNGNT